MYILKGGSMNRMMTVSWGPHHLIQPSFLSSSPVIRYTLLSGYLKILKKKQSRHQWYYNVQHILTFLGLINDLMIHWPFCSHHLPDIRSNLSPNNDVKIRFLFSPYIHVFNCTLDKACLILVRVMEYICLEVITYVVCKLLRICIIEFIIFLSLHPNNVWRN